MGKIERFEDLVAWVKARALTYAIYEVTRQSPFSKDFGLSSQIQRAAVSIMSNIAEGFERRSLGEFQQFLTIAKASCAEMRSQLYLALDCRYPNEDQFRQLQSQAEEVARILSGLRAAVERKREQQRSNK